MAQKMKLPNLPSCDPEAVRLDKETLEIHSEANARQIAMGYMPGVAECAVKDNHLIYVDIRGYQDKEMRVPMTEKSLFRCHSMTKPITAVALMSLWEEKKLALDDPVHKYIPAFKNMKVRKGDRLEDAKRPITLRHLVMHTSGLGYGPSRERKTEKLDKGPYLSLVKRIDSGQISNLSSFCEELAQFPLQFHPGDRWEYSMGLDVLGRVMEVVSGLPLDRLFRQLFRKMGMKDTAFSVSPRKARRQLTAYYVTKVRSAPENQAPKQLLHASGRWMSSKDECLGSWQIFESALWRWHLWFVRRWLAILTPRSDDLLQCAAESRFCQGHWLQGTEIQHSEAALQRLVADEVSVREAKVTRLGHGPCCGLVPTWALDAQREDDVHGWHYYELEYHFPIQEPPGVHDE